ncbi:MAG: DNA helicase, partial [Anaerobacillus sp.]
LLTGQNSERLINVAMTRTKGKFIHVSNVDYIKKKVPRTKTLHQLVDHHIDHHEQITPNQIGNWVNHHHPKLTWHHAMKTKTIFSEIAKSREIIVAIPSGGVLTKEWEREIKQATGSLTLVSSSLIRSLPYANHIEQSISFPFIVLDRKTLWLGVPFEGMRETLPPAVAVRLQSSLVIGEFLNQIIQFDN